MGDAYPFFNYAVSWMAFNRRVLEEAQDPRNPLLSPVFANVAGLPPTLIHVGDDEILLSDSTRFADKLKTSGINVEIEVFPEMWHVFQLFVGKMPESKAAVKKIGAFIQSRFSAPAEAA